MPIGKAWPPVGSRFALAAQSDVCELTDLAIHELVALLNSDTTAFKPLPAAPAFIQTEPVGLGVV